MQGLLSPSGGVAPRNHELDLKLEMWEITTLPAPAPPESVKRFPLDKQSSDNSGSFLKFAKKEFGKDNPIQQCGVHFTLTWKHEPHRSRCSKRSFACSFPG